jgi:hypothetical protein
MEIFHVSAGRPETSHAVYVLTQTALKGLGFCKWL